MSDWISDSQLKMMKHCVGYKPYKNLRNYYCAVESNAPEWRDLVGKGLAEHRERLTFGLTSEGMVIVESVRRAGTSFLDFLAAHDLAKRNEGLEAAAEYFKPGCSSGEGKMCATWEDGDTSASHDCPPCLATYRYREHIRALKEAPASKCQHPAPSIEICIRCERDGICQEPKKNGKEPS